eukprot:gene15550-19183_t
MPPRRERSRDRDGRRDEPAIAGHPWPVLDEVPSARQLDVGGDLSTRLVFVMMGGANMAGRAPLPKGDPSHQRLFSLDERGRWRPACEPLHPHNEGSGPGVWLVRRPLELLPDSAGVFLIPCACTGSRTDDWAVDHPLFAASVMRATRGAAACGGEIAGV